MASDVMQLVPVRIQPDQVEKIDLMVAVLGGNRSEFIRMAVDERLARMAPVLALLDTTRSVAG